jgi:hypothetical protein
MIAKTFKTRLIDRIKRREQEELARMKTVEILSACVENHISAIPPFTHI